MSERETDLELFAKRRVGAVLRGKYRLDRVLGIGGMAVVYKATHRNQAEFAVKILHPELSIREDVRTRFLREGYAANSVKHPGAVLVVDDDVAEDGAAFLVMELLDGEGVEAMWERLHYRLPVREAAAVVVQMLDVLAAAHAKGIVHRDVKPANLFVTRDGMVKVLDFGIARARDAAASGAQGAGITGTGMLLGTPAFMPPEQALALSAEIDGQTDVWAAGATLFTLVSGHYVHEGDNAPQLMIRAATAQARPVASIAPDVPLPIAHVVDRALAFEKRARWPTATAMRDALDAAMTATFGRVSSREVLFGALGARDSTLGALTAPVADAAAATVPSAPPAAPDAAPLARPSAPAPAAPPPTARAPNLVGGTTAQPTSSHHSAAPPSSRPRGAGARVAVGAGVAAVIVAGSFALLRAPAPSSAAGSVSPEPTPLVTTPLAIASAAPLAPSTLPPAPAASVPLTISTMPSSTAPPVTPKPKGYRASASPPPSASARVGLAAPAAPAPSAPAAPTPPKPAPTSDNPLDINIK